MNEQETTALARLIETADNIILSMPDGKRVALGHDVINAIVDALRSFSKNYPG